MRKQYRTLFINRILVLIVFLLYNKNFSQNQSESKDASHYLSSTFPASPDAFKLGNYGNLPVGLFTGSSNISLPLLNYNVGNIKLPISVNYSSNGVKVDDTNGSLGLTWNLLVGGVVTRTVRGLPDELSASGLQAFPNIDILGVLDPTVVNFIKDGELGLIDTEPDLYTASFLGNNIKFVFDKNGQPIVFSQKNYRIGPGGLEIITEDGTKYNFDSEELIRNRTFGGERTKVTTAINSWYLTKITDIFNNMVYIDYEDNDYKHIISQSQTMLSTIPGAVQHYYSPYGYTTFIKREEKGEIIKYEQDIKGKLIKRIYSNNSNFGSVEFEYQSPIDNSESKHLKKIILKRQTEVIKEFQFVYDFTLSKRRFLKEIKDMKNNTNHNFEYYNPSSLPERLSYSRDLYGYYNAKINSDLIPKLNEYYLKDLDYRGADQSVNVDVNHFGLLKKITYPTKGSSEIFYEPNGYLYKGLKDIYSTVNLNLYSVSDNFGNSNTDYIEWTAQKDELIKILITVSYDDVCAGDFNDGKQKVAIYARNSDGSNIPLLQYNEIPATYTPAPNNTPGIGSLVRFIEVKKGQKITFSLKAEWRCTTSTANIYPTTVNTIYVEEWKSLGGNRVSKTVDESGTSDPIIKNYLYENENGVPSYVEVKKPYFIDNNTNRYYEYGENGFPTGGSVDVTYNTLTSSNLHQLNASHPNLFYGTVIESIPNKGSIVHHFNTEQDWYGNQLLGNSIQSAPWSNYGWKNGKEIKTIYRDDSNTKLREIIYDYDIDQAKTKKVQGLSIRKKFIMAGGNANATITCNSYNIGIEQSIYYCAANHNHFWELFSGKCKAAGHIDSWIHYRGPCFGRALGSTVVIDGNLENLDVVLYDNMSYNDYLKSQITIDYINGIPLTTTTEYYHNNINHFQLTDQKTIFPNGSSQLTNYKYAHDKPNQKMIDANMVGIPLITETTKTADNVTKTISKTETIYPTSLPDTQTGNLLLPKSSSSLDLVTGSMSTEVTYNQYDIKGNLQQYTTKSGIPTAIIWGYNNTQPIAKIEGATYSQISSLASAIISASDTDASAVTNNDESSFLGVMKTFREALPNYQVTTYTYDPLVGVRSITPPNGIKQIYIYDNANRLKEVRENSQTGNLLKEYQYNYAN